MDISAIFSVENNSLYTNIEHYGIINYIIKENVSQNRDIRREKIAMNDSKLIYGFAVGILAVMSPVIMAQAAEGGREVPHYDIREMGGTWDNVNYILPDGTVAKDVFFCDGEFTYYLMADGTPMTDRLTYHPDGEHIIYFDSQGHEVFSDFIHVMRNIEGNSVDDYCFFDTFGYMYQDKITYDKEGVNLYYANPYGVLERNGWFRFSDSGIGYANADGTLVVNEYRTDWNGENIWLETNGYAQRSWAYGIGTFYQTRGDIRNYMASSGADPENVTDMQTEPVYSSPYEPGVVTQQSLQDALAMLNQMRYIAGLSSDVTLDGEYTREAQAGAFLNALNRQMSHYPERPEGIDDALYELGCKGASSSNLAVASWRSTLSFFVELWMDDSDSSNIGEVGHRRWILNPGMKKTGFGYAAREGNGSYGSFYAFDNWVGEDDGIHGVAWPAREMPLNYFSDDMAWSYASGENLDVSEVSVKLTNLTQGREWNFSAEASDGYFTVNNANYGQTGCVIFRPDGISIREGDEYLVNICRGGETIATYLVSFFL